MQPQPHILYIDNNEFNQRLTSKILTPDGFSISHASDGIQGIQKAYDLKPDLILMDLNLPDMDGLGVAAKIKSMEGLEETPLVALIPGNANRDRGRALVAGCDGFISKPVSADTFSGQIRNYLAGKRERSESPDQDKLLLKDVNLNLVNQLQGTVVELEKKNLEILQNNDALQDAYEQSQKANQEQQRLAKLKEHIVAITSHELRTPLSIAKGYNDLLLEGTLGEVTEEQCRVLTITNRSLNQMRELIDKMTDLTRLALKKFPTKLEELDLNDVILKVYHDHAFFMNIRRLAFIENLNEKPVMVQADRGLLHQVFANLLKNSICFTPDGGKVTVSTRIDGNKAYFQIKDTGIGIQEDDLEPIFEEFYQVQDVHHHKTGHFEYMTRGIGVGLSLCRGILNELGGKIVAESPGLNQGSTFTFYLPAVMRE